ncbi:VTT domain-containing protein [Streptomyces sp. enrichment culture]|uniref:VTT domain-containing protein n=1 Tax=Streptomyces sp. enrichment culture TaxID=1795815 RepID=UPI003F572C5F
MTTLALGPEWLSPDYLISTFSLPGILLIVFAESGLFAFLPGDSLLFTAGLFVAEGNYISQPLWLVCTLIVLAAVIGDQVGYMIGKFFGPKLFSRPNSKLFKQENLEKAHEFMEKYGPKAIVLARFVPIVRTFAPIVAGAGRMQYRTFLTYNIVGGIAWGCGVTVAGYWLGQIDLIKENVETILILIVFLSVVPIIVEYLRERAKKKRAGAEAAPAAAQQHQAPLMDDATTQLRRIAPDDRGPAPMAPQAPRPQQTAPQQAAPQPYGGPAHGGPAQGDPYPYGGGAYGNRPPHGDGGGPRQQPPQPQQPYGNGPYPPQGHPGQAPWPGDGQRPRQPYDQGY